MPYSYHEHEQSCVDDFIDDSIHALTDPVAFLARQLLASRWPWVERERANALHDSFDVLLRERSQVLRNGLPEDES